MNGYVGQNPLQGVDPAGLFCVSADDSTTCSTDGVTFKLPTPLGFPASLSFEDAFYHHYNITRNLNGADASCVMKGLIKTPTPDSNSKPASADGTSNNATFWLIANQPNFIKSYLTKDLVTGQDLVVNFAGKDDGSLFGPGYVVRFVKDGYAHTAGEGLDWAQSDIGGTTIQWIGNQIIWGMQMSDIISDVKDKANTQCGC